MRLLLIGWVVMGKLLLAGCLLRGAPPGPHPQVTIFDVKLAYPLMDCQAQELTISAAQAEKIREFYGQEVFRAGENLVYYTVEPLKHRGQAIQVLGEVVSLGRGEIGILVGLHKGTIREVSLWKGDMAMALPGLEAFLSQFPGRDMGSSFELATQPEDLLALPAKLRPIPGHLEASKHLADLLRRMAIVAGVLKF